MRELLSRFNSYRTFKGRPFRTRIVLFVSALLVLSCISEFFVLRYYEQRWDIIANEKAAEYLQHTIKAFVRVQQETFKVAADISGQSIVVTSLSHSNPDRAGVFELVNGFAREHQVGVELYNGRGQLIAWDGSSEPSHQQEVQSALAGKMASFVTRSQVFSQLFVVTPVRQQDTIVGVVLVRRTTELNYPLNNRLIVSTGLTKQLSRELGVEVEFDFTPGATVRTDGRYVSAPLVGIDSSTVGIVSVERPSRGSYLQSVDGSYRKCSVALWIVLAAAICTILGGHIKDFRSVLVRSLAVTGMIWTTRYLLLWLDIPSTIFQASIFDPTYFASGFGGGLAKSIGELFLSALALFLNAVIVGRYILINDQGVSSLWRPKSSAGVWFLVPAVTTLIFLLLRAYAATIRSAVYDSTLRFNDPTVIIPSFELAVMMMGLFLLSVCLIGLVAFLTLYIYTYVKSVFHSRKILPWVVVSGAFAATAVALSFVPSNPLVTLPYRLLFAGGMLGFVFYVNRTTNQGRPILRAQNLFLVFALSAVLLYPILDDNVHERDRDRIQRYALEVIKPADSWLKFILEEALQEFSSDETAGTLSNGDADAVDALAFDHWARSTVAKEGYSCIFIVRDIAGAELSRFMIGGQTSLDLYAYLQTNPPETASIITDRSGTGANAIRVYSGSVPIKTDSGEVFANAQVVIAASQQALFRGESPSVLRTESSGGIESFSRPIAISDFRDNRLFSSSTSELPLEYQLPPSVQTQFADSKQSSFWLEETMGDRAYETFYIKRPSVLNEVVALSTPQLDVVWHLLSVLKLLVYYAIILIIFFVGLFAVRWLRGYRYEFTFRDRLLGALLVTALVPLIVMAAYGRQLAKQRLVDSTSKRLEQETSTLGVSILQRLQGEEGIVQEALSRYVINQLANEAGTDFNLYVGNQLQASSRPELYDAGILDKRISGPVYENTILKGKRFYLQTETIGSYEYAVGYRSLVGGSGRIVGIVAVPTLYRYEEIEDEISKRNVLIFSLYAVIVFFIVLIATTFANRIAAPIHKLTHATKKVARGEMNVSVGVQKADGEIGELIRSFEVMTRELARSRDELVRVERELAWKEMAKQVAHEIKNPLTPMKLSMQHLRQTYRDRVANFEQIFDEVSQTMIEQIDALSRIASEFARFARMPKATFESVDVNSVIRESVSLFEQDDNVRFEMSLTCNLSVRCDREELRRAFINIIRNGIQAMSNAGSMSVRSWSENGKAVVIIMDHGVGIADEVKAKLFQPNFSTKTDGMGLGLAITKKTVDDIGGSITIESIVDQGTTVTIILPLEDNTSLSA